MGTPLKLSRLHAIFDAIDDDGSGSISRDELEHMLLNAGLEIPTADVQAMIDDSDLDGNGQVRRTPTSPLASPRFVRELTWRGTCLIWQLEFVEFMEVLHRLGSHVLKIDLPNMAARVRRVHGGAPPVGLPCAKNRPA